MNRTTTLLALAALAALGACKSSTGTDGGSNGSNGSSGSDTFTSQTTLTQNYTAYSDGGQNWSVSGGELIATGENNQSVLIRNGVSFADGWIEATSIRADDGGLVLRFKNANEYYLLAFRDDGAFYPRAQNNLALYHRSGLSFYEMWNTDVSWARGTSHTVRFEAAGQNFDIYFDGQLVATVTPGQQVGDPSPSFGSGGVGMRAYGADATWTTQFEEFRWHTNTAF